MSPARVISEDAIDLLVASEVAGVGAVWVPIGEDGPRWPVVEDPVANWRQAMVGVAVHEWTVPPLQAPAKTSRTRRQWQSSLRATSSSSRFSHAEISTWEVLFTTCSSRAAVCALCVSDALARASA